MRRKLGYLLAVLAAAAAIAWVLPASQHSVAAQGSSACPAIQGSATQAGGLEAGTVACPTGGICPKAAGQACPQKAGKAIQTGACPKGGNVACPMKAAKTTTGTSI
ncbi:MAG: hypothetical protein WDA75_03825 [Candidatus Latescibacterota bacterium]